MLNYESWSFSVDRCYHELRNKIIRYRMEKDYAKNAKETIEYLRTAKMDEKEREEGLKLEMAQYKKARVRQFRLYLEVARLELQYEDAIYSGTEEWQDERFEVLYRQQLKLNELSAQK